MERRTLRQVAPLLRSGYHRESTPIARALQHSPRSIRPGNRGPTWSGCLRRWKHTIHPNRAGTFRLSEWIHTARGEAMGQRSSATHSNNAIVMACRRIWSPRIRETFPFTSVTVSRSSERFSPGHRRPSCRCFAGQDKREWNRQDALRHRCDQQYRRTHRSARRVGTQTPVRSSLSRITSGRSGNLPATGKADACYASCFGASCS